MSRSTAPDSSSSDRSRASRRPRRGRRARGRPARAPRRSPRAPRPAGRPPGRRRGRAWRRCSEHAAVLERVVPGDDAAVGLAVGASVQLFWRIVIVLITERAWPTWSRPRRTWSTTSRSWVSSATQRVVDVDEVLRVGLLRLGVRRVRRRPGSAAGWSRPRAACRSGGCRRRGRGDGDAARVRRRGLTERSARRDAPPARSARSASTWSRTAGATSRANRRIASASSVPRMKVLMPSSIASPASCSAQSRALPWRKPLPVPNRPKTLYIRRIACGPRPLASARSSITAFISASCAGRRTPSTGSTRRPGRR